MDYIDQIAEAARFQGRSEMHAQCLRDRADEYDRAGVGPAAETLRTVARHAEADAARERAAKERWIALARGETTREKREAAA